MTCFDLLVDLVDLFVGQFILGDDEQCQAQQGSRDDAHQPKDTFLGKWSLLEGLAIITHKTEDSGTNNATEGHTSLEEQTGEGVDDARNATTGGVFAIGNNLRNQSPHVTCSHNHTRTLDELGNRTKAHM